MSYEDKMTASKPAARAPEPWDSGRTVAPDPSLPLEARLHWYQIASHVLLLNVSEACRRNAAAEADRELAKWMADRQGADVARDAEVLHSEHHPGTLVPSLDSCPEHDRADYEDRVRRMSARTPGTA